MAITTVTVPPSAGHTHTVVFLHDRGDNARNCSASLAYYTQNSRGRSLPEAFSSFRWVFPEVSMYKCASPPHPMFEWFDTWSVLDMTYREYLQAEGLKEVVPPIRKILADEAVVLGGRWDRLILAGISMGATAGAHTLLNLDVPSEGGGRLGALVGFSGRCPFTGRNLADVRKVLRKVLDLQGVPEHDNVIRNTPVLLQHCIDDPIILIQNGRKLRDILVQCGAQVDWKEYPIGGHWFNSPEGMDDAVEFLNKHLGGDIQSE